jgi:hypothetical protein
MVSVLTIHKGSRGRVVPAFPEEAKKFSAGFIAMIGFE